MPATRKSPFFKPTFAFPMAAVGALLAAFLVYYFPITSRQAATLKDRAFRSLAAVSDGFQLRVSTYVTVFEQAVTKGNTRENVKGYLAEQAPDLALAEGNATAGACTTGTTIVRVKPASEGASLELSCGSWAAALAIDKALAPHLAGAPTEIFDDVLLADATGAVLYQSMNTGSRIARLPADLTAPQEPTASGADEQASGNTPKTSLATAGEASGLYAISLAGEPFGLYLTPVAMPSLSGAPKDSGFILAGLIRERRFRAESMAVPGSALVATVLTILAVIVAAWPFLKFSSTRPTERLPRRSAVYFSLSTLGTVILLCVLTIHLRYIFDLRAVDKNLEALADAIERNLENELDRALRVMDSASRSELLRSSMESYSANAECGSVLLTSESRIAHEKGRILSVRGLQLSDYPYFDRIFFADNKGRQHMKWDISNRATWATPIGDRVYYMETVKGNLWQLSRQGSDGVRFRVDPIFSRNTGEYRAVISRKPPTLPLCRDMELSVMSMVTPLLSLNAPVMPPDYGFALVDRAGNVLFHSTPAKSGRENFLSELDDERDVAAILPSQQGRHVSARYAGFNARMFVAPILRIQPSPWSLIVFSDLSRGSAQNLERIVLFSCLALSYYALFALALFLSPLRRGPMPSIWPEAKRRWDYVHIALTLVLLAPALYASVFYFRSPAATIAAAFFIPFLSVSLAALKLSWRSGCIQAAAVLALVAGLAGLTRQSFGIGFWSCAALIFLSLPSVSTFSRIRRVPTLDSSFAALFAVLLLMAGVLPGVAFFRVAYDYHANLSTRRQQMETIAALAAREERVKARYADIMLTPEQVDETSGVSEWLFLRRRLEQSADRYDTAFLSLRNQEFTRIYSGSSTGCSEDHLPTGIVDVARVLPYGKGAVTRVLSGPSENSMWRWCREGLNRIRLARRDADAAESVYSLPPARALFKAMSGDPFFTEASVLSELPTLRRWSWSWAAAVFLAAWWVVFRWVRPTLRQMFLLKTVPPPDVDELSLGPTSPLPEKCIALAFDSRPAEAILGSRKDVLLADFREVITAPGIDCRNIAAQTIAVANFDHLLGDAQADSRRLEVLERLAADAPDKRILLLTAVDPVFAHAGGPNPDAAAQAVASERWMRALRGFSRKRLAGGAHVSPEDFPLFWSTCTPAERVVLSQLAHDGWVNACNDAALAHLELRGIVGDRPRRILDERLLEYLSRTIHRQDRKAWEKQDDVAAWDGIRLMFVVVLLGLVAAVLFFNQQTSLSLILTGLGVLTPLTKLLSEARSLRSLLGLAEKAS